MNVTDYIKENISKTLRFNVEDNGTLIGLPFPYTVPCVKDTFNELYYWDTYFLNKGLMLIGMVEQAKNNCLNMFYLVEKFGYMPNGNRIGFIGGSQPPYLALMVDDVFNATNDFDFIKHAYPILKIEYEFWMSKRISANGLNRYYTDRTGEVLANFYKNNVCARFKIQPSGDYYEKGLNYYAEAESGWDFTPRFDGRATQFNPIDLNCNLYSYELIFAKFEKVLGISDGKSWEEKAEARKQKINSILWNDERKIYLDYDFANDKFSTTASAASFSPYFVGLADDDKTEGLLNLLKLLEEKFAISTTEKVSTKTYQWAYPNAWAPLQLLAVVGLDKYGLINHAKRIAQKYVDIVENNFKISGGLWEKYNAVLGNTESVAEYKTPQMMGWTAGVYLFCKKYL